MPHTVSDDGPLAPVCILAGGRGTRLGQRVKRLPKPLLPVAGEPFVFHQLRLLQTYGAFRIVFCVGYLGEQFEDTIGDGSSLGLQISYAHDGPQLVGTAGAIRAALHLLGEEFLVLYGDTYLRIDYRDVSRTFRESGKLALMTVLRNDGQWDASNTLYVDGMVARHDKHNPSPDMAWIDYGLGAMRSAALDAAPGASDLSDLYSVLAERGELAGFEATERFYEIGTPDALSETEAFLRRANRPFA